jgi:DNA-directed RNA polymerase subunit L
MSMEIVVLENTKSRLRFQIVGRTHTLANLITKKLWDEEDVVVSGYNLKHPQTANVELLIETTKKDPKKVLLDTLTKIKKESNEFKAAFKKIAK